MGILEKEYGIKTHRQTIPADVAALHSFGMEIQEVMAGQTQAENLKRNISPEDRMKYDNESIYLIIDGINEAINAGKKISFLYFKYDVRKEQKLRNEGKPFIFSPHRLVWNGDFYSMVGVFDHGKRVGTFHLNRIQKRPDILEEDALPGRL